MGNIKDIRPGMLILMLVFTFERFLQQDAAVHRRCQTHLLHGFRRISRRVAIMDPRRRQGTDVGVVSCKSGEGKLELA